MRPADETEDADVVVVGAGISGLSATRELITAGLTVTVLEARNRVGGRLLSHPTSTTPLDLGATWFWPGEPHVARLIEELGIATFGQHLDGDAMYHEPGRSRAVGGNPLDVPSGRFVGGADGLTEAIADRLPRDAVRLNQVVRSIESTQEHLVVTTSENDYRAGHVVLAVPPALAAHQIAFRPALPDRLMGLAKITPVWMGGTTKVVAHYADPFWRRNGLAGSAISHYGPMREMHDMSGPDGSPAAIFGFVPSTPGAATVEKQEIVAQLVEIFGPQAAEPLDVIIQDWRREEFTTPPGGEQLTAYQAYGHDLYAEAAMDGRLHWSSTETAHQSPGHIEGAISAAHRAVKNILKTLPAQVAGSPRSNP